MEGALQLQWIKLKYVDPDYWQTGTAAITALLRNETV
jgi:hypothetical protein